MNMFLNTLEKTFDEYFQSITEMSENNPRYLEEYRKELNNFCQFLVQEYNAAQNIETYWLERSKE